VLRRLTALFLRGLSVVLPLGLTAYLLWWLGRGSERLFRRVWEALLPPDWYLPGLGIVLGLAAILAVGVLMNAFLVRRLVRWMEAVIERVPLVKTIYGSIRDLMAFFGPAREGAMNQVVWVEVQGMRLVGFVTREPAGDLTGLAEDADKLVVYLPMSYQLGGYMVVVDRDRVTPSDLSVEDGLRLAITAGASQPGATPNDDA